MRYRKTESFRNSKVSFVVVVSNKAIFYDWQTNYTNLKKSGETSKSSSIIIAYFASYDIKVYYKNIKNFLQ